jgi:hypothetical protein
MVLSRCINFVMSRLGFYFLNQSTSSGNYMGRDAAVTVVSDSWKMYFRSTSRYESICD